MPQHKGLRKTEEVNFKASVSFFTSLSVAEAHVFGVKFIGLYGTVIFTAIRDFSCWGESDLWSDVTQFFLRSVIFPYNSLYTQAVAYTTYMELREPVIPWLFPPLQSAALPVVQSLVHVFVGLLLQPPIASDSNQQAPAHLLILLISQSLAWISAVSSSR